MKRKYNTMNYLNQLLEDTDLTQNQINRLNHLINDSEFTKAVQEYQHDIDMLKRDTNPRPYGNQFMETMASQIMLGYEEAHTRIKEEALKQPEYHKEEDMQIIQNRKEKIFVLIKQLLKQYRSR
jgi:negative regulator of sigma E activity